MYKKFCCGCGLCESQKKSHLVKDEKGFLVPKVTDSDFESFCSKVCPISGIQSFELDENNIWGKCQESYIAYSSDDEIRYMASSGGVLTSLCCFLVEQKYVDAIIHTKEDTNNPISTITVISKNKKEIIECCGSRYSSSSPLKSIEKYLNSDLKYAFVGKPCDVTTLRNFAKIDKRVDERIPYMLSFFCAGAPSEKANLLLLEKMNCDKQTCKSLKYRGDGWPGYATAIDKNGKHQLPYREVWKNTLGRDIRTMCRFCLDGIGEQADISCCDAWKIDENKKPVFNEDDGLNAVFIRNSKGQKIYDEACKLGYINSKLYDDYKEMLPYYQSYQFERRATMHSSLLALKMFGKEKINYNRKLLNKYAKNISLKKRYSRFKGTYERIKNGKI